MRGRQNWVVTSHEQPIPVLEEFAERVSGSGDTGALDGPEFLAALLEWVLGAYTAAFERIEQRLEEFDVQAMRGEGADEDIERLVADAAPGRQAAASACRPSVCAGRADPPELEVLGNNASGERFKSLFSRFEATLQEARDAREAIVGSFDVLIARGGHQTNQIMKVLTLTSVILLPGALLAGVMGMNFKVGLFENPWLFWVVVGGSLRGALTIGDRQTAATGSAPTGHHRPPPFHRPRFSTIPQRVHVSTAQSPHPNRRRTRCLYRTAPGGRARAKRSAADLGVTQRPSIRRQFIQFHGRHGEGAARPPPADSARARRRSPTAGSH